MDRVCRYSLLEWLVQHCTQVAPHDSSSALTHATGRQRPLGADMCGIRCRGQCSAECHETLKDPGQLTLARITRKFSSFSGYHIVMVKDGAAVGRQGHSLPAVVAAACVCRLARLPALAGASLRLRPSWLFCRCPLGIRLRSLPLLMCLRHLCTGNSQWTSQHPSGSVWQSVASGSSHQGLAPAIVATARATRTLPPSLQPEADTRNQHPNLD